MDMFSLFFFFFFFFFFRKEIFFFSFFFFFFFRKKSSVCIKQPSHHHSLSRIVRKPDFCLCENKGADQLRSNCEADQHLCFRYLDSTIPLLLIAKISSL